jgi:MFS family permease
VLARRSAPRLLVALLGAQWVVIGALDILFVVLAVDVLDRGEGWVGYLSMAYGAGGVLAGLAGMALVGRRRLVTPILGGVILIGAALGLSALAPTAAATVVLLTIVGGGRALFNLATRTPLQRAVPAEVVGRVFGVVEALAMAGLAVGSAIVPLLVAVGGTVAAVLGTAAILPLVALVGGRALFALDAAAHVPIVEIALLRSLRIFRALPAPALEGLARSMEPVELAAGEVLIREGEPGHRFYAIADGRLQVTIGGAQSPPTSAATALARSPCSTACRARPPSRPPRQRPCSHSLVRTSSLRSPATRPLGGRPPLSPMSGSSRTATDSHLSPTTPSATAPRYSTRPSETHDHSPSLNADCCLLQRRPA